MHKVVSWFLIAICLLIIPFAVYTMVLGSVSQLYAVQEKVLYNLPYPGILPDNPIYFIKIVRDRITEFATREQLRKAQVYLLMSDKRVAMAQALVKKGKDQLAIDTFTKAEKYFLKIPSLITSSKKQGNSPTSGFIDTLKLSNAKHREIGQSLLKDLPQGMNESVMQALNITNQIRQQVEKL